MTPLRSRRRSSFSPPRLVARASIAGRGGASLSAAIRPARVEDVEDMRALIARYAADDRMLVRSRDFLLEHLRDFVVAQDATGFLGCCALAVLTPDLAEVRLLAVTPE